MKLTQELEMETLDLEFPDLPEEIEIKFSNDNKKYNVLALGDVVIAGEKGLKDFNIKSLFPAEDAKTYINNIETMINNKKPMRFILIRDDTYKDINMSVVIDEFSYKREGGEGDVSFTLKFTEFREFIAKEIGYVQDIYRQ